MSTLTVQNIQGSSSSGNTINVASGHVLQAPGHVLQVKSAVFTDVLAISSADTRTDITNLSLSITPSSTSSKILVNTHISYGGSAANLYASGNLLRDSSALDLMSECCQTSPTTGQTQAAAWTAACTAAA